MTEKQSQHDLVQAIINEAIHLGRTPKQFEFKGANKWTVDKLFGNYSLLIQAAGLDPSSAQTKKNLPNSVFEKNIEEHILELNLPKPVMPAMPFGTMAVISDIHWPFMNQKVVDRFYEYVGDEKPDYVIINGDAWDMYSHAKFPRSHNIFMPKDEEAMARKLNEDFWSEIKSLSPKSICFQMLGNHDVRPLKRTVEAMPTMEHWIQDYFKKLFSYDGVTTYFDSREELYIGDILVFHGYRSKLGEHRDYTQHSCINGHTHRAGIVYRPYKGKVLFEMNSGLAGNPEAKGLTYTPQRINDWTESFASLNRYGPQVVIV